MGSNDLSRRRRSVAVAVLPMRMNTQVMSNQALNHNGARLKGFEPHKGSDLSQIGDVGARSDSISTDGLVRRLAPSDGLVWRPAPSEIFIAECA